MNLNFTDSMILVLFIMLGILIWWFRGLRRRQQTAPPAIWRPVVSLLFSVVLIIEAGYWYRAVRDEYPLSLIALLVLGIWGFQDSVRLLVWAQRFRLFAQEIAADEVQVSDGRKRSARRKTLLLAYQYLEKFQGHLTIPIQSDAMRDAFRERDLRVLVRYLPDDPQVHRVAKIEFGSSLDHSRLVSNERDARDPKYNQALILQYLSFLAGLGEGFIIFSDPESGAFVQFAAVGLGSVMLDLPVKAMTVDQREKTKQFFLDLGIKEPQSVAPDLVVYQMEFSAGPRQIRRASRIGMEIFTTIYGLDPTFELRVKQGE